MGKLQEILDSKQFPGVTGTRDSFGIKNEFVDERTGKTIDNYKSWERAGYRPSSDISNEKFRREVRKKEKKCKQQRLKRLDNSSLPL